MSLYRVTCYALFMGIVSLGLGVSVKADANDGEKFPLFSDELAGGRQLWMENCQTCHAYGVAGAPIPMVPAQWKVRLQSPLAKLYRHAIEGFYGESDTHMPARGGNSALTDAQVMAAVDYMVALATHYLSTTED